MSTYQNVEAVLDVVASAFYFPPEVGRPSVDTLNIFGSRPLQVVITWGDLEAVELLLSAGAPLDAMNEGGNTALHHALEMGHFGIARHLINAGADQGIRNDGGKLAKDLCWEGEWKNLGLNP